MIAAPKISSDGIIRRRECKLVTRASCCDGARALPVVRQPSGDAV
jgi:hypothetical protein